MYDSRIQYAMDNFIEEDYFLTMKDSYELKEGSELGKSLLHLSINGENICVQEYDNNGKCGKCSFLKNESKFGMQKCIDHFILKKQGEIWDLHMIEMKTGIGNKTWKDIKLKNRASFLNIKTLCVVLGITIGKVYTYTTYEEERFDTLQNTANIKSHVPLLGEKAINFKKDEWDKGLINVVIDKIVTFPHIAIKMKRNGDSVLEGSFNI